MPKRTHSEFLESSAGDANASDRAIAQRRKLCSKTIERDKTSLLCAFKLAAGFERQKSGRRRKEAREKGDKDAAGRIDREYQVLKALDLEGISESYLNKILLRIKSIAASPALPSSIKVSEVPKPDTATINVLARLYKSTAVQKALENTISDVRVVLGVGEPGKKMAKGNGGKNDVEAREGGETYNAGELERGVLSESVDKGKALLGKSVDSRIGRDGEEVAVAETRISPLSDGEAEGPENTRMVAFSDEDSDEGLEGFEGLDARIASSSEASSEESSEESKVERRVLNKSTAPRTLHKRDLSITPSPSLSPSLDPSKATKSKPAYSAPTKSTFIPSLSMGGYWSGSDSGSEDDLSADDNKPRKNRRGQRARQQTWEKKFGAKAKHLEAQKNKDRAKGWDAKRGAQADDWRRGRRKLRPRFASDANQIELKPRRPPKKDDAGPLHPSWEAAKAAKEKKTNAAFQGKKIVFD
ncbi:Bud-site selection protein [Lepidopterella palustris CBS 459.81]|uniref:Bud-site selection protein n=1 Tax=Lepidopterella palustris CBS 459.81 TaxID=1314670 RepID=A0A8E2E7Q3_9PEZI|nr:Bud-site selection protein [Lepidopterella palustris CBS 459.81]